MEVKIQAIHFDIADRLVEFINKKAQRLTRRYDAITDIDVTLKVVKPETAMNKEAIVKIIAPQLEDIVATKTGKMLPVYASQSGPRKSYEHMFRYEDWLRHDRWNGFVILLRSRNIIP